MGKPIIRLATHDDVAEIAQGLHDLVQRTGWKHYPHGVTVAQVQEFVERKLLDSQCVMYVCECDGMLTAFCGAFLSRMYVPPHHTSIYEWGWFGTKRHAVLVWQAVVAWGKHKGAKIAGYILAKPNKHPRLIDEHIVWKVL